MKKPILLTFAIFLMFLTGANAQSNGFAERLLNQLGIPWTYANPLDIQGSSIGYIRVPAGGVTPHVFLEYRSAIPGDPLNRPASYFFVKSADYEAQVTTAGQVPNWAQPGITPKDCKNATTDEQIYVRVKAGGGYKPAQLSPDGRTLLLFGQGGYAYIFSVITQGNTSQVGSYVQLQLSPRNTAN